MKKDGDMKTNSYSIDIGSYVSMGITSTQYMLRLDTYEGDYLCVEPLEVIDTLEIETRYQISDYDI